MKKTVSRPAQRKAPASHPLQANAMSGTAAGKSQQPPTFQLKASQDTPVQRTIGSYVPNRTLACTTKAMRGLGPQQMKIVQQLHDDPHNHYTIDQARAIATGVSQQSNPFEWDVTGLGSYLTPDAGVQDILNNFGHPTSSVVKTYDDLASRVGHDVGKWGTGALSPSTVTDLHQMFEASAPLHLGLNPYMNAAWNGNLASYSGGKTGIPLYSVGRSKMTKDFEAEDLGTVDLNSVLKAVSGRPFEVHHLLYKSLYPQHATNTSNLMLTERSRKESVEGPGQHELMHKVSSGNHKNKFKVELDQFKDEYANWVHSKMGDNL